MEGRSSGIAAATGVTPCGLRLLDGPQYRIVELRAELPVEAGVLKSRVRSMKKPTGISSCVFVLCVVCVFVSVLFRNV